jgi:hypothetical protein
LALPDALAQTLITSLRLLRRKASSDKLKEVELVFICLDLLAMVQYHFHDDHGEKSELKSILVLCGIS